MSDDFYQAQLPDPVCVIGMTLRPLSLGHLILLNRLKSKFIVGGIPDWADLASSVLICAQTYEDALASIDDPDLDEFMRRWHDRISGNDRWSVRIGFKSPTILNLASESLIFRNYLEANTKTPKYSYDPSQFRKIHCASEQIVKIALMRDLHFSESEILNRSWLLCLWDYVTLKTLAGQVEIQDEESMRELQEAQDVGRQLMEQIKKGKLNGYSTQPAS